MMCVNFTPDKFMERMAARDAFAAVPDGDIIGTISFSLPRARLYSLFIEPHAQRAGIGKRLVEQHARTLGRTDLQLSAAITARPFYDRLGFATKRFEERVGDGSTWLMSKRLRQPWRARMHAASGPHLAARLPRRSENAYHLRWFVRHPGSPGSMEVTDGRCNGSLARC
jgi:putative acetyltransferase